MQYNGWSLGVPVHQGTTKIEFSDKPLQCWSSKTPYKVLIQKACDSLYLQLFLEPKDSDSVAFSSMKSTACFRVLHHGLACIGRLRPQYERGAWHLQTDCRVQITDSQWSSERRLEETLTDHWSQILKNAELNPTQILNHVKEWDDQGRHTEE